MSGHIEYLENRSRGLDVNWQQVRGDLTVHPWRVTSCGASQSAVRRRWLSLCTVWLSQSQWPSKQISFIATMRLTILQLSCTFFFGKALLHPGLLASPPLWELRFDSHLFPKLKSPLKGRRFVIATSHSTQAQSTASHCRLTSPTVECDCSRTVTQYTSSVYGVSLPTD